MRHWKPVALLMIAIVWIAPVAFAEDDVSVPRTFAEKLEMKIEGNARTNGQVTIVLSVAGGESYEVSVGVVKKMSGKKIAEDIAKELQLAASSVAEIKLSGDTIRIKRLNRKDGSNFSLEVTYWNVYGVKFSIDT